MPRLLLGFFLSASVFAAETETPLFQFDGKELNNPKRTCSLFVMESDPEDAKPTDWEDLRLVVTSSFKGEDEGHPKVPVQPLEGEKKVLETPKDKGKSAKVSIRISLGEEENLFSAKGFLLTWAHGNHAHTFTCVRLKLKEESP